MSLKLKPKVPVALLSRHPTQQQIRELREKHGITQQYAADIAESSLRTWAAWEAGESKMHPAIWKWFCHELAARAPLIEHNRKALAAAKHK